jgi:hypothetical protein
MPKPFAPKKALKALSQKPFSRGMTGITCRVFVARRNDGAAQDNCYAIGALRIPIQGYSE